jgi:hypothetical protein
MLPRYDKSVNGGIQAFSQHVGLSGLPQKSKIIKPFRFKENNIE